MEMSGSFAALGLFTSYWIYSRTNNRELASGVFFFFLMEFLQAIQYIFIAPNIDSPICDSYINKFLTILGFLHICLQPYYTHVINASLTKNTTYLAKYVVIKRLCLMGGLMLFGRFLLSYSWPTTYTPPSTEWLRGEKICTFKGNYHLSWSIPMADATYVIPGAGIHSFLMFAPFFALYEKKGMIIQGIFLFAFGPYLASYITPSLMEQASIWCFFSIAQISIMLFCIRETLIINWGKNNSGHNSLLMKTEVQNEKKIDSSVIAEKKSNQDKIKSK